MSWYDNNYTECSIASGKYSVTDVFVKTFARLREGFVTKLGINLKALQRVLRCSKLQGQFCGGSYSFSKSRARHVAQSFVAPRKVFMAIQPEAFLGAQRIATVSQQYRRMLHSFSSGFTIRNNVAQS